MTSADSLGSVLRPKHIQAATNKPSNEAGCETSREIGPRSDATMIPEAAPIKTRGALVKFWTIHNPNTSQNTQARLSSDGNIKPASIRSITVRSVPSACAHVSRDRALSANTRSGLTNKVSQTNHRNHASTVTNHQSTAW